ncbi:unnamed protein product [Penicillium olsonii]|nr:unnamed protein product [Penicillium olsonii]
MNGALGLSFLGLLKHVNSKFCTQFLRRHSEPCPFVPLRIEIITSIESCTGNIKAQPINPHVPNPFDTGLPLNFNPVFESSSSPKKPTKRVYPNHINPLRLNPVDSEVPLTYTPESGHISTAKSHDESAKIEHLNPLHLNPLHLNPLHLNPLHLNPLHLNPLHLNPLHLNPLHLNPLHLNPLHLNPLHLNPVDTESSLTNTPDVELASLPAKAADSTRPKRIDTRRLNRVQLGPIQLDPVDNKIPLDFTPSVKCISILSKSTESNKFEHFSTIDSPGVEVFSTPNESTDSVHNECINAIDSLAVNEVPSFNEPTKCARPEHLDAIDGSAIEDFWALIENPERVETEGTIGLRVEDVSSHREVTECAKLVHINNVASKAPLTDSIGIEDVSASSEITECAEFEHLKAIHSLGIELFSTPNGSTESVQNECINTIDKEAPLTDGVGVEHPSAPNERTESAQANLTYSTGVGDISNSKDPIESAKPDHLNTINSEAPSVLASTLGAEGIAIPNEPTENAKTQLLNPLWPSRIDSKAPSTDKHGTGRVSITDESTEGAKAKVLNPIDMEPPLALACTAGAKGIPAANKSIESINSQSIASLQLNHVGIDTQLIGNTPLGLISVPGKSASGIKGEGGGFCKPRPIGSLKLRREPIWVIGSSHDLPFYKRYLQDTPQGKRVKMTQVEMHSVRQYRTIRRKPLPPNSADGLVGKRGGPQVHIPFHQRGMWDTQRFNWERCTYEARHPDKNVARIHSSPLHLDASKTTFWDCLRSPFRRSSSGSSVHKKVRDAITKVPLLKAKKAQSIPPAQSPPVQSPAAPAISHD